jgi:homoserine kinase type II
VGTFTRLGDRDVAALASAFGLGNVVGWRPIAAGTINSNFHLETVRDTDHPHAETSSWFLRVNEGKSEDDVAYEAKLVEAFAAGGVPTPAPIAARDGRRYAALAGPTTKWVSAFPWRPGVHLAATEVTPDTARKLGAALAQLHVTGLALPEAWQRASIYDHAHLVARYRGFDHDPDPELARAISILGEELAEADRAAALRAAATHGIIHGDLFRDNVLWDDGPGEGEASPARAPNIVAILDFEQASGGSLPYDLAVCLNDWCWLPAGPRFDLVAALLDGYRTIRSLPEADRAALVIEVRAAAARFTITRITDVYLARVSNPEKDFRAFLARCEAWRGPALGQLSSLL